MLLISWYRPKGDIFFESYIDYSVTSWFRSRPGCMNTLRNFRNERDGVTYRGYELNDTNSGWKTKALVLFYEFRSKDSTRSVGGIFT